ncbi:unnamed protein product, partial [Cylicocyclus nassatus]
ILLYRRVLNDLTLCFRILRLETRLKASKFWIFRPCSERSDVMSTCAIHHCSNHPPCLAKPLPSQVFDTWSRRPLCRVAIPCLVAYSSPIRGTSSSRSFLAKSYIPRQLVKSPIPRKPSIPRQIFNPVYVVSVVNAFRFIFG